MPIPRDIYPFDGHHLDVGGHRMHYLDEGDGPPVVMVHGNPSWSIYYRNLVRALRDHHRCLVPDHIGCGLSDKPGDDAYDYTLQQRVADLDAFLAHTVPSGPLDLVVHDWGGMIGFAWAVEHPERIRSLVVLNTAAFPLPDTKPLPWQLKLARDSRLGAGLVRGFNAFNRGTSRIGCTRNPMPARIRDAYAAPYDSWDNRIATLRFVQDIPLDPQDRGWDLVAGTRDRLHLFGQTPTLIVWGDLDIVFDHHFLAEWRRRMPHAEVLQFDDCGHYILEDAGEEAIAPIVRFLDRAPNREATP
jgi:haloalkane dehalogenase